MRAKTSSALAGLLCLLLSACSSTGSDTTSMNRNGENYSSNAGSGMSGGSDGSAATVNNAASMEGNQSDITIASATVLSIEPVARSMDLGSGETQAGSSGTTGATAGSALGSTAGNPAGSTGNMMYRVTLRLDDGRTRAIMQNSQPTYQVGDKVKMLNGMLQSYSTD